MTTCTYTENGILMSGGLEFRPLENRELFEPKKKYSNGDLLTEATHHNIYGVCESLMQLFVRPMGLLLDRDKKWGGYINLDVVKKHRDGSLPYKRSKNNLTRGWCYLLSGVLHRFFYSNYDLYKVKCPFDKSGKDFHWWLESKCRLHVIDLTQEQYLKRGIKDIRKNGKKIAPMGHSYGMKTRNMAFLVATHLAPDAVELSSIQQTGYMKKYPQIIQNLQSKSKDQEFDPEIHASIRSIKFHSLSKHSKLGWDGHLTTEITKYWEGSFIKFDPDKTLLNPIKFIEKKSNKLTKKDNYFHVEKLVLDSNQTKLKKVEETFSELIFFNNGGKSQSTNIEQTIRIYNTKKSLGSRVLSSEIDDYWIQMNEAMEEILVLQQKFIDAHTAFYQLFDEMKDRNRICTAERIKKTFEKIKFQPQSLGLQDSTIKERDIKRQWFEEGISFEDWKNGESPSSPLNDKKAIDSAYEKMNQEGYKKESPDWTEHFKKFRGMGALKGMSSLLEEDLD